jgi:hypothetical protein
VIDPMAAKPFSKALAMLATAAILTACTSTGASPELGMEESFDGLRRVKNSRASAAWMRPDFDVSSYTKVRLEGAGIEFQPVRRGRTSMRSGQRAFPVTEAQEARLVEILVSAFRRELARSERFELVETKGPDVLTLWGGLLDVVSFVPPERPGRSDVFLSSVGEATLVIELRDSLSHATLARVMDRRAATRVGTTPLSSPVMNWAEVRRVSRRWATLVRTRLDASAHWRLAGG